jgi:glutaredoxin|tara:strand:+ start:403 stop:726 length:324 start_codon:yes stop_codon:yes gene_type:complete
MMFMGRTIFKMYVKTGCPFCEKAREIILKDLKCSLHLVDVTDQPDLREMIINNTGQSTVPVIYIGEEFIGGCDDLIEAADTPELKMKILVEENCVLREEIMKLRRSL